MAIVAIVSELEIRHARAGDAAAVAAIYNDGIEDRLATFETRTRTPAEVQEWLEDDLPFIVAVAGEEVVGFARVSPYSDRCVYQGVGEHGVYVARSARGGGVGRRLLDALVQRTSALGITRLHAYVLPGNDAALGLFRAVLGVVLTRPDEDAVHLVGLVGDRDWEITTDDIMADLAG